MQFEVNQGGASRRLTLAQMFALSMGAVTTNTPLLGMAQTWNAGAVTFTGWQLNVTDAASAAASRLLELQVGGVSKFSVGKDGRLWFGGMTTDGIGTAGGALSLYISGGAERIRIGASALVTTGSLQWAGTIGNSGDVVLAREAANVLALRNGTNAQEFRLYNSYTDPSNHERLALSWSTNVCRLWTVHAGTGAARDLVLGAGGSEGIRLGPDAGSGPKLGFYGAAPIARAQLSTGAAHTVDDVITALQNLGLVSQS